MFLKLTHLAEETLQEIEDVLHRTERPSRGRFHAGRSHSYERDLVEMHVSEIGLCSGHSASGVWVDEHGQTTLPGLYTAGDMACVPHNYLCGALTYGAICAESALRYVAEVDPPGSAGEAVEAEARRISAPLERAQGIPHHQYEYKVRRLVNDYLQPPKSEQRLLLGLSYFERAREELDELKADDPHELMRVMECGFIRDCAEMAARASLFRTESRWGLYHYHLDYPELDNERWLVHVNLKRAEDGTMQLFKRPLTPYVVPIEQSELTSYYQIRVKAEATISPASAHP